MKRKSDGSYLLCLSRSGRLKRSLGDNKKTNPVREVCGREKILVAVIGSKTRES